MTNDYVKFHLVRAIAEVAKRKHFFTVRDVWEHVRVHPETFPTSLRKEAAESRLLAAAFAISRRPDRRLCRVFAKGAGSADQIGHAAPRAIWESLTCCA